MNHRSSDKDILKNKSLYKIILYNITCRSQ